MITTTETFTQEKEKVCYGTKTEEKTAAHKYVQSETAEKTKPIHWTINLGELWASL